MSASEIDGSLLDPEVAACPFAYYHELRDKAPVYRMPETGFYVISTYEDLKEVLSDPEPYRPRITYIDHQQSIPELAGFFEIRKLKSQEDE